MDSTAGEDGQFRLIANVMASAKPANRRY